MMKRADTNAFSYWHASVFLLLEITISLSRFIAHFTSDYFLHTNESNPLRTFSKQALQLTDREFF